MFVTLAVAFVILGILIGGSAALVWLAKRVEAHAPEFMYPMEEDEIARLLRVSERRSGGRATGPAAV